MGSCVDCFRLETWWLGIFFEGGRERHLSLGPLRLGLGRGTALSRTPCLEAAAAAAPPYFLPIRALIINQAYICINFDQTKLDTRIHPVYIILMKGGERESSMTGIRNLKVKLSVQLHERQPG